MLRNAFFVPIRHRSANFLKASLGYNLNKWRSVREFASEQQTVGAEDDDAPVLETSQIRMLEREEVEQELEEKLEQENAHATGKPLVSQTRNFQAFGSKNKRGCHRGAHRFFDLASQTSGGTIVDKDLDGIPDDVPIVKDVSEMRKRFLPNYTEDHLRELLCDRRGDGDSSFFLTVGLHTTVKCGQAFEMTKQGLKEVPYDNPTNIGAFDVCTTPPESEDVPAIWTYRPVEDGDEDANVLGDNHSLTMATTEVDIPVVVATEDALSYYGATLIKTGDHIEFPQDVDYPIWAMNIGKDYVDEYIMREEHGGGMYLEFHMDKPHLHIPISPECGGGLILGRKLNDILYRMTSFYIPYGYGVYTSQGALHNDATMTGPWLMGYDGSGMFSTALLMDTNGENVKLCTKEISDEMKKQLSYA